VKYIVTSGCSFTNTKDCVDYTTHGMDYDLYKEDNYKSWALHLEDIIPDSKVYNRALPGIGNGHIVRSIIWQVNELLKQNIKPTDVFMQVTSPDRKELLLDCEDMTSETDGNLHTHYIPDVLYNTKKLNDNKLWLKHSYEDDSIMKYHYKYYNNKMSALVETLENMLRLEWFLKLHKINYKIFFGWTILNFDFWQATETEYLWGMLDSDNVWFYKNYGGITQWVADNLLFEDRYVTGDRLTEDGFPLDQHPSNKAHREFAKQVVSKWVK
jgi:hypothetical protein